VTLRIHLPGFSPVGMPRPRACVVGGHARMYTPSRGTEAKDAIRLAAIRAVADLHWTLAPRGVPLSVRVVAEFGIPASRSKKRRAADLGNGHAQKPDCDNVGKLLLDALTGIVWTDDDQVATLTVLKRWAEVSSLTVYVEVMP
jgi:Holliday junction resolvase RusA-like endonuclease